MSSTASSSPVSRRRLLLHHYRTIPYRSPSQLTPTLVLRSHRLGCDLSCFSFSVGAWKTLACSISSPCRQFAQTF